MSLCGVELVFSYSGPSGSDRKQNTAYKPVLGGKRIIALYISSKFVVLYENNLICIFTNINEKLKMRTKPLEKLVPHGVIDLH